MTINLQESLRMSTYPIEYKNHLTESSSQTLFRIQLSRAWNSPWFMADRGQISLALPITENEILGPFDDFLWAETENPIKTVPLTALIVPPDMESDSSARYVQLLSDALRTLGVDTQGMPVYRDMTDDHVFQMHVLKSLEQKEKSTVEFIDSVVAFSNDYLLHVANTVKSRPSVTVEELVKPFQDYLSEIAPSLPGEKAWYFDSLSHWIRKVTELNLDELKSSLTLAANSAKKSTSDLVTNELKSWENGILQNVQKDIFFHVVSNLPSVSGGKVAVENVMERPSNDSAERSSPSFKRM